MLAPVWAQQPVTSSIIIPRIAIVGINISPTQIERSILNAPDCKFLLMDAVNIEFKDNFFDNIICVESAFYFNTREKFLKEAWRVLKPGEI